MKIKIQVLHSIKGRARIRVCSGYQPEVFFRIIEALLCGIEEARSYELNSFSESVTIYFSDRVPFQVILDKMEYGLARLTADPSFHERMEEFSDLLKCSHPDCVRMVLRDDRLTVERYAFQSGGNGENGALATVKKALPPTALAAGLVTLAAAPALATPTWLVLLIFSFTSFHTFNPPPPPAFPGGIPQPLEVRSEPEPILLDAPAR